MRHVGIFRIADSVDVHPAGMIRPSLQRFRSPAPVSAGCGLLPHTGIEFGILVSERGSGRHADGFVAGVAGDPFERRIDIALIRVVTSVTGWLEMLW